MKHYFVKGQEGNWFNEKTKYYLGTDIELYQSLLDDGWTLEQLIDSLMQSVNDSLKED
ncbi:hypothetical protein VP14_098 [Vibrio phage VPMCC14]|nr:hypothetical protein VP14_098 [Vibrio phage VPMCC14]